MHVLVPALSIRSRWCQHVFSAYVQTCHLKHVCSQVEVAEGLEPHQLEVTWKNHHHTATLKADVKGMAFEILATRGKDAKDRKTIQYQLGAEDCSAAQSNSNGNSAGVQWTQQEVCHTVDVA